MKVLAAAVSLARLHYSIPFALACALTIVYAAGGAPEVMGAGLVLSTASLALVLAGGYALNDAADVAVDRIGAPWRPIPAGRIGRRAAAGLGAGLIAAGLAAAAACRPAFLVVLAAVAAGLVAYDASSKRLGPGKQLLVAALTTSIYPLAIAQAGGAAGPRAATLAVFPAWLFLTSLGYEVLKDLRDLGGDLAAAARPTPLMRRPRLWRGIAGGAIAGGAALLVLPRLLGCGPVYMWIAAGAMGAAALAAHPRLPVRGAIAAAYVECLIVGIAATADLLAG